MAQRTVALCEGKYIGIETIYTVVDGCQINIPDKLRELREKSRSNELFCPCGCGANLILVAGDKNLREQHFRIKDTDIYRDCHMITEGKVSVDSKIVIKCWLDDVLHASDLESRVPISAVSDSSRKYEFTFISRESGIGVNYCHDRANLSDEKLRILEDNAGEVHIIHIVDCLNGGSDGQYPEGLMKVQSRQRYCLLLSVEESDYDKAKLKGVFFERNIDGLWQENCFIEAPLKEYRIERDGSIVCKGENLTELLLLARKQYQDKVNAERIRREEEKKKRVEQERQKRLEAERREEELRKKQERREEQKRRKAEERKLEEEKMALERQRRDADYKRNLEEGFLQQETPVIDSNGIRWIKCEYCGMIGVGSEFSSYGGIGHVNLGTCNECSANNPAVKPQIPKLLNVPRKMADPMTCPECGRSLIERNGPNGKFLGCKGFPRCKYTRSIRTKVSYDF